jgi:hypothetical protein
MPFREARPRAGCRRADASGVLRAQGPKELVGGEGALKVQMGEAES